MAITEQQRAQRRGHLGGSDMAAVLGLNPRCNAADVYYEKTEALHEWPGNEATDAGNRMEAPVLDYAEEMLGELARAVFVNHPNPATPIACNLDAVLVRSGEPVEAKTAGLVGPLQRDEWGEFGTDAIPQAYLIQAQTQLACLPSAPACYIPVLLGGRGFGIYETPRNDRVIGAIEKAAERFWNEHIIPCKPPVDLAPNIEILKRMRREEGKTVEIDAELLLAYLDASELMKSGEDIRDDAKARVLTALGDAEIGTCTIGRVTYKWRKSPLSIDREALRRDGLFEKYCRQGTHRHFDARRTKGAKDNGDGT